MIRGVDNMIKKLFLPIMLMAILFIAACSTNEVSDSAGLTCNKPYILVGDECCLDLVENGICDKDEAQETVCPEKECPETVCTEKECPETLCPEKECPETLCPEKECPIAAPEAEGVMEILEPVKPEEKKETPTDTLLLCDRRDTFNLDIVPLWTLATMCKGDRLSFDATNIYIRDITLSTVTFVYDSKVHTLPLEEHKKIVSEDGEVEFWFKGIDSRKVEANIKRLTNPKGFADNSGKIY